MNYELALKLKNAGFPQRDYKVINPNPIEINVTNIDEIQKGIVVEQAPTLSELIEACGDKFDALVSSERSGGWMATDGRGLSGDGPTPEEAVANLWLELNKK